MNGSRLLVDVAVSYDIPENLDRPYNRKQENYHHLGTILPPVVRSLNESSLQIWYWASVFLFFVIVFLFRLLSFPKCHFIGWILSYFLCQSVLFEYCQFSGFVFSKNMLTFSIASKSYWKYWYYSPLFGIVLSIYWSLFVWIALFDSKCKCPFQMLVLYEYMFFFPEKRIINEDTKPQCHHCCQILCNIISQLSKIFYWARSAIRMCK